MILQVPNCDLFEKGTLPNLGNGLDINYILDRDGCYLGLIQRKVSISFCFNCGFKSQDKYLVEKFISYGRRVSDGASALVRGR